MSKESDILAYRISLAVYNNDRAEFDRLGGKDWDAPWYQRLREVAERMGPC